jgi:hypothetical protein
MPSLSGGGHRGATMKRLITLALCATLVGAVADSADANTRKRLPRFEDYPVKEVFTGKSAQPILETEEQRSSATYYQAVADGGANFAGHYAVVILHCGKNCTAIEFLDVKTGRIAASDITNSGWRRIHDGFRDIEFRRASRLIVMAGQIDQKRPSGWHFYLFDNGKLKKLRTVVTRGDFRKPLEHLMR